MAVSIKITENRQKRGQSDRKIYIFLAEEVVGGKIVDNRLKPLKILGNFVYTPVWKKENVIHAFPQRKNPTKFSTGGVDKGMFIMWIT